MKMTVTYVRKLSVEIAPTTSPPARIFSNSPWTNRLLLSAVMLLSIGCNRLPAAEKPEDSSAYPRRDLLIGYDLLAGTLSDESGLDTLGLFKKVTLNGPNDEIDKMMKAISAAAERRASELSKLRRLAPDVSDKPTEKSPIGDAIYAVAKDIGSDEMTSRAGGFDIRFVLLQAQATRMVSAMATAIARFDTNPERKAWLKSLAKEYEGFRNNMVKYVEAGNQPAQ